jgi:signal transduction histidine kinase
VGLDHPGMLPAMLGDVSGLGVERLRRSARDWGVDILFIVVAAGVGGVVLVLPASQVGVGSVSVELVVGGIGCCALWLRRRWPVGLAVVLCVASVWFPSVGGASALALFTVAVHRRAPTVAALTGLGAASALLQYRLYPIRPDTAATYWGAVGVTTMLMVMVVAWGMVVRVRRQLVVSLAERARRAETEQGLRIGQARLQERERIAREMHDVLAHRLSLLSMHAGALEFRPDAPVEEVGRAAGIIRASAHQSLVDLQEVIRILRDESGEETQRPQPTLADLPELVEETRQAGTSVEFVEEVTDTGEAPTALGRNVYRIVQEGLTNARKHASAATVRVSVRGTPEDGLTIEMRNSLSGRPAANPVPGAGAGLAGLGERASLAGGRLEHGRTVSGEFRLWAWLPWPT